MVVVLIPKAHINLKKKDTQTQLAHKMDQMSEVQCVLRHIGLSPICPSISNVARICFNFSRKDNCS